MTLKGVQIDNLTIQEAPSKDFYRVELSNTPYGSIILSDVPTEQLNDLFYALRFIFGNNKENSHV